MCDEWMPVIKLRMTIEQFWQLPRNPAYKYEYLDGQTCLSPRPRHYHALLDLKPLATPAGVSLRRLQGTDWVDLLPVFSSAFRTIQPFGSLDDSRRMEAAGQALERTRTGGDGPLVEQASFVATSMNGYPERSEKERAPLGGVFITMLPEGDPCDWDSFYWKEPAPADCIALRLGRPHLTWIFVSGFMPGQGLGTALLGAAVNELLALGYTQLLSTFILGNDSSMLWHWRNGFQLLTYPGSIRRWQQRTQGTVGR